MAFDEQTGLRRCSPNAVACVPRYPPRTDPPGPGLIPSASGDRHLREITAPAAEVRSGYLRAGMIHLDGRIGLKHCCPSGVPPHCCPSGG